MVDKSKLTPALRQFFDAKEKYKEHILFFRMGDFYEMFFDDAIKAAKVLEIALTKRGKGTMGEAPMCGIPYHAYEAYAAKLLKAGYKVAVCEQVEDPKQAKGVVRREVVTVLTPSTSHLSVSKGEINYLTAVYEENGEYALVVGEPTTGDCRIFYFKGQEGFYRLKNQILLFEPREIVTPHSFFDNTDQEDFKTISPVFNELDDDVFNAQKAEHWIQDFFKVSSSAGFGLKGRIVPLKALAAYLFYLEDNYKTSDFIIKHIKFQEVADYLILDSITRRNLDLFSSSATGKRKGSLIWALDRTTTPMGGRRLSDYMLFPLKSAESIEQRLSMVEWMIENRNISDKIHELFDYVGDMDRILTRITLGSASPVELNIMKSSLSVSRHLKDIFENSPFMDFSGRIHDLTDVFTRIATVLSEDPPKVRGRGMIQEFVDSELDSLRSIVKDVKSALNDLEQAERQRSGIQKLKVKYNKVFGYYIEISKANLVNGVPENYDRKQTLVNAERFITPELKEFEEKVLTAEEQIDIIENRIYQELLEYVASFRSEIFGTADAIGDIDAVLSFADISFDREYIRPQLNERPVLVIKKGRHPVVELFEGEHFVPNDAILDQDRRIGIITGPNMGGKSTYLRQNALIVLMAHMGCFVPAGQAEIGITDRIFSRVGSSDNLVGGQSTFMVEMVETANILNNATTHSMIILDEVGRGTATFDGLSLAWAITEFLAEKGGKAARTYFATHYHELTEIDTLYPNIINFNVVVKEWNNELMFLRKIVEGSADKSYGIQVARLAGLPEGVINRAFEVLSNIEKNEFTLNGEPKIAGPELKKAADRPLLLSEEHPVLFELKGIDINNITPLQALNLLDKLKKNL